MKINAFTMRYEIWKGREKKSSAKGGIEPLVDRVKRHDLWFTTCATGADNIIDSAVLLVVLPVPWLTDVSSSQRWVIYSQTNGAVSNYTYLFRFVWFVVVFSDLLFCFWICRCVFFFLLSTIFYFFFTHNTISKIKQNKTADTYSTSQGSIKREGEREGQQEHKSYSFK